MVVGLKKNSVVKNMKSSSEEQKIHSMGRLLSVNLTNGQNYWDRYGKATLK